jgi:ribonuclease VapC
MFLDASAIIAIIAREEEADALAQTLARHPDRITSPLAVWESVIGLAQKKQPMPVTEARRLVEQFLTAVEVKLVSLGEAERDAAIDAFERFGKGRHRARLNMGDCFAYACARTNHVPLLFKGKDFIHTDIPIG